MHSLRQSLAEARARGSAIGHFNVSDLAAFKAIVEAARELSSGSDHPPEGPLGPPDTLIPVMIGVSEGERAFIGVRQVAALVRSLREEYDYPVYLNADHTHSLEKVVEAASAGFDEVLFDGSRLPFAENIRQTRQAVELARAINPNIVVEGEIGFIGGSSEILEEIPAGVALSPESLTNVEEAKQFVSKTGVDVLAPAVGNMHGLLVSMLGGRERKRINIARVKELGDALRIPMTLHGGSGTADEDFVAAARAGMNIIHVSTELRVAWRRGVEEGLAENAREVAPYKILPPAVAAMKEIVKSRLRIFRGLP